jgi:DNA recombination protein RmuC
MGDHFAKLGSSLRGAVESYNDTVASLEARVLVSARRFKGFGAGDGPKEIDIAESIEIIPRQLRAPEITGDSGPSD